MFRSRASRQPVWVDGDRGSVLVTGLGYKLDDLPGAFGQLPKLSESDFAAVLRPRDSNEWNPTPIEVWINDVHIGYVNDDASSRYWKPLRKMKAPVSCGCVVKTTAVPSDTGFQVGKVHLSLPSHL